MNKHIYVDCCKGWHTKDKILPILIILALALTSSGAIITTPTMTTNDLKDALHAGGLMIDSISIVNGVAGQFGTYSNFDIPPVTIRPGIVLSSGNVADLMPFTKPPSYSDPSSGSNPNIASPPQQVNNAMDPNGLGNTAEFNVYGLSLNNQNQTRIENFQDSHDVAALRVDFTLNEPSQVKFDFIFGSVEYPFYTGSFTDAFLVFLDGTAPENQITFDANRDPVQVGVSFADQVTTADLNTAFSDPHGVIHHLTMTTAELSDSEHYLIFEVGDVNDPILDSAAFITNLRAEEGIEGTEPSDDIVPESGGVSLIALSALCLRRHDRIRSTLS